MAKCKECTKSFGLLELKNGICKQCLNKLKPPCASCKQNFEESELIEGFCSPCRKKYLQRKAQEKEERESYLASKEDKELKAKRLQEVILTTESDSNLDITERLGIVTSECAYGMNIFKDLFTSVSDVVGGRSKSIQNVLKDAKNEVLDGLKQEAVSLGANAVVAVNLDYNEFSGGGKSMLFVVATGTAVKIKSDNQE